MIAICLCSQAWAQSDPRSDSIDIIRYGIVLDITDFAGKSISGECVISLQPKLSNVSRISLDLLGLAVDSVKMNGQHLSYSYNDPVLGVQFGGPLVGIQNLKVYYQGVPVIDGGGSGWGGFYFQGEYAFNLGVGFQADPHKPLG